MWKNRQVQLCLFSVLLALLTFASSLNGDSKYMVLVPSQLYTDTPEKICLHLYHLNESVTVTISLVSQWGRRKLFDELVVDKDLFQCVSFIIHRFSSSDEEEFLYIDIKGPTHTFSERNTVIVKNKDNVVFVQTDKPVYKPGQSVNFRIVSMDRNLHPLNELVSLSPLEVNITELQSKKRDHRVQLFHVTATVTEEGTGLEFSGSGTTKIERTTNKLVFLKADSHFRHGIPFFVKVRLVDIKGAPIPNEQVFIKAEETSYTNGTTTDQHGVAKFSIDTASISGYSLHIKVYHKEENSCSHSFCMEETHAEANHVAYAVYSLSKSYIYFETETSSILHCNQIHTIQAHFILKGKVLGVQRELVFYYLVMAQRSIIQTGNHTHLVEPGESDKYRQYILKCKGYLKGAVEFPCSLHPVLSMYWVTIYNLPSMQCNNVIPSSQGSEDHGSCTVLYRSWITDEHTYSVPYGREKDFNRYVGEMGLIAFTNLKIKHPVICYLYETVRLSEDAWEFDDTGTVAIKSTTLEEPPRKNLPHKDPLTETIRKYFPETWIWDIVTVNSSGVAEMEMTVPDTITEWKAGALCLSNDTGLGLSSVVPLQAFQPFFVELTLPYSVIRGEAFILKATVLNYLPTSMQMGVQMEASPDFTAVPVGNNQDSYCLHANGRHTSSWLVTPKSLGNVNFSVSAEAQQSSEPCGSEVATVPEMGRRDTVVKVLRVEPEGIKKEHTFSSLFCTSGENLSKQLTAFVLKSFAQARAFIFIDESHITHAFTWLSQQQKDNGCFRSSGSLFNNAMKGGVDDEVTLSAYITMALLESSFPATHPVVSKALSCLESSWKTIEQGGNGSFVYTKALMAYAFALAGNQDRRNEILKSLDEEAIKEDNSIHWERPQKPRKSEDHLYKPQASSAEVEMNAYVVLARLTAQPAPTPEDLTLSRSTIKWLTKQQNSNGGFSSTQDTVVALDALSKYGAITFSRSQKSPLVTIQSSRSFSQKFQVENSNRLLLQQVQLPDIPGEYTISMSGEGCVYAQTTLRYNIHLEKQQSAFALQVQTVPLTCDNPNGHNSFQISLEISYTGTRSASNMVIVDVKMVSGFIPLKPTVKKLERLEHMSRTEVSNNNVLLYLDQVTNQTLAFSFIIQQDIPVRNLQPAIVKVYDYYETEEAETSLPLPPKYSKDSSFTMDFCFC
ncbi:murinoglobulin-1-like [Mastomys coucha]|uniref:murinoglobulin-1-like n=1 Tax=Mastomys coucha TaxID=35658 RepID=UPI00126270CF|nr:murinoglobulin-1-like [Mastomys coucha]